MWKTIVGWFQDVSFLYPKICLCCDEQFCDEVLCEECRVLVSIDSFHGRVELHPTAMRVLKKIEMQPIACRPWVVALICVCLEADRFQGVDTLVTDVNGPLYSAVKLVGKRLGIPVRSVSAGWLWYALRGRRRRVAENWAFIELGVEKTGLDLYMIPEKIYHLPLFLFDN
ncbi:MAG: hypothetical protein ACOYK9_01515 [Chlamydiia bacterium]